MTDPTLIVEPALTAIVRPHAFVVAPVQVRDSDAGLDSALRQQGAALRSEDISREVTEAVRAMYRRLGLDPTKTRPSSEALRRRIRKGGELPRVNTLVDVINWCSAESGLPFGLYDLARIRGAVEVRRGRPGEEYSGIRKDVVHLEGRLALADAVGPFGNPTSDSARTMITPETTTALVVIFVPAALEASTGSTTEHIVRERIARYSTPPNRQDSRIGR